MSSKIIQTKNLWKVYTRGSIRVEALRGVNLEIERGELVSIVGPSGSGKTTLLNCLGGLDRPTKGEVVVSGVNISVLPDEELVKFRREKVGFVFQFFNLLPEFTALENVIIPMLIIGKSKDEAAREARELLREVGLLERADHYPYELSGGEMQRVAIARALANDPLIVLMDEPTGNLDSKTTLELMKLVRRINREKRVTFVIVTHNKLVADMTEKKYRLEDGKIIE
ncbi:MAG: hypothetical protein DRJ38_07035 [Thermoprotei archaeon]|nr:MAG: hypothetical protein DRJ38_07035 [Thermoprotei archaeon]